MTRLSEKLRLPVFIKSATNFPSSELSRFSLATLRLCSSIARLLFRKTLASFFPSSSPAMYGNDLLSSSSSFDDNFFDYDSRPRFLPHNTDDDFNEFDEKLYLVPFTWWSEAQSEDDPTTTGVLYNVSSEDDDFKEIVLNLRKEEQCNGIDDAGEEGLSGRVYALLSETMWLRAFKWHSDSKASENDGPFNADDYSLDVFSIQIRLSVSSETNSLVVKISSKDNFLASYRKVCDIFESQSQSKLRIWDFSEQTTKLLLNAGINLPRGSPEKSIEEIPLELQVYGFSDFMEGRHDIIDGKAEYNKIGATSFSTGSVKLNGIGDFTGSYSKPMNYSTPSSSNRGSGILGLTGLYNLGNTCFMNSSIQCLVHTPKLVDYFLGNYRKEINTENPLGMHGELALAFGDLLRKLWAPGSAPVAPRMFKLKLANFAPQFSGSNQHDSQEFLAFLLDGLHEDLNRVKNKPYVEAKDADDRPDKEIAEEYWLNHLVRNDSIIVDLFQGQYRSTLVCPVCKKKSVTFDPFMYLSVPLPSTTMRTMTLTVLSTDGKTLPFPVTITVPKCGRLKDLIDALTTACSLRDDETLMVVEIYRNKIVIFLEDPSGSLALIRDDDKLAAYRLPKDSGASPLVVFMHERVEKPYEFEKAISNRKLFGIPLVARLSDLSNGFNLHKQFLKLLNPFLMPDDEILNDYDDGVIANEDSAMDDVPSPGVSVGSSTGSDSEIEEEQPFSTDFKFYLKDDYASREIKMNEPVPVPFLVPRADAKLNICVFWSDKMIEKYDTCLLSALPEVFKPQLRTMRPQESVSLYKCLEAFLKEEPLGPEDMWHCPSCKKPRQACKKLDLWRLPEILVVHLKRFSYGRHFKNKLETFVDFPIDDLDLSTYIAHDASKVSDRYVLYATSNHYGSMGSGHYTATVDLGHGRWYEFDDSRVTSVSEDDIRTSTAYVLFYRRIN